MTHGVDRATFLRGAERLFGKYPGRVVDNVAPQGGAHRGELLVEIPGILEETPDGSGERALQAVAKPCFAPGFFFVPEIGSPVWVEFVAGDVNTPVWTGVFYPEEATPPTHDDQAPTQVHKVVRTVSGHVVELDDDAPKLVIRDAVGNQVTLDDAGVTVEDLSGNQVFMDDSGVRVADKNGNEIVMEAGGVVVTSDAIKLGSSSSAEPLVLGNQWMQLFNTHMHIGNMGAPTSPPTGAGTPATPSQLSATHKTE